MMLPPSPHYSSSVELDAAVIVETERIRQTVTDRFRQVLESRATYSRLIEMVTRDIILAPNAFVRAAAWHAYVEEES